MKFKQYINETDTITMLELGYFVSEYDELNEGKISDMISGFKSLLPKIGLESHKGKGLIEILALAGKGVGLLLYYAFKVSMGDESYKEKMKEVLNSVKKEDVVDVLLKLDVLTLHAVTTPIHVIDALTGWHLGVAKIIDKAKELDSRAKTVLQNLATLSKTTAGETQRKLSLFTNKLKNIFKYSSQISTKVLDEI